MRVKSFVAVVALVLVAAFVVQAQDTAKPKPVRLVKPWNQIGSLSEEQKTKIADIHAKKLAAVREVEKKERADIIALLTDEQKAEVKKVEDAEMAAAKERGAAQSKEKDE